MESTAKLRYGQAIKANNKDRAERIAKVEAEKKARTYGEAIARAKERAKAEAQERTEAKPIEILDISMKTVTCECCGKRNVPENQSIKIDSGQLFCSDCLKALRQTHMV